jgi:hypothetical protein
MIGHRYTVSGCRRISPSFQIEHENELRCVGDRLHKLLERVDEMIHLSGHVARMGKMINTESVNTRTDQSVCIGSE